MGERIRTYVAIGLALLYATAALTGDALHYMLADPAAAHATLARQASSASDAMRGPTISSADRASRRGAGRTIWHRHGKDQLYHVHRARQVGQDRLVRNAHDAHPVPQARAGGVCNNSGERVAQVQAGVVHTDHDCALLALVRCLSHSFAAAARQARACIAASPRFEDPAERILASAPSSVSARGPPDAPSFV